MSITFPRVDYAEFQARTIPCHAIGGDFYDVIELPGLRLPCNRGRVW